MKFPLLFKVLFLNFLVPSCTFQNNPKAYRILIVDARFCQSNFYSRHYQLRTFFPLKNKGQAWPCPNPKDLKQASLLWSRPLHGHQILTEVTKGLDPSLPFEFYLINVFTQEGRQSPELWKKAVEFANEKSIDLVITATGYFKDQSLEKEIFLVPLLAASGNALGPLAHRPQLFPQSFPSPQKYLVGAFFPQWPDPQKKDSRQEGYEDLSTMNRRHINLFMPGHTKGSLLSGSSLAVALAANFFLKNCAPLKTLRNCIKEKSSPLNLRENKPGGKVRISLQKTFLTNNYK